MKPRGTTACVSESTQGMRRVNRLQSERADGAQLRGAASEDGGEARGELVVSGFGCVRTGAKIFRISVETFPVQRPGRPSLSTAGNRRAEDTKRFRVEQQLKSPSA